MQIILSAVLCQTQRINRYLHGCRPAETPPGKPCRPAKEGKLIIGRIRVTPDPVTGHHEHGSFIKLLCHFHGESRAQLINREPMEDYIQTIEVEQLNDQSITFEVLVAGEVPPNPSELIGSGRMQRRLEQLATRYDFILLDLPPVTAVTDALVATKLVDGIVMVVRNEHADRRALNDAIRQLRLVGGKILGFVFTCAGGSMGGYRYKYKKYGKYRSRYYQYGDYEAAQ